MAGRVTRSWMPVCAPLHRSGWINFRMRAMLASFAAYHLWAALATHVGVPRAFCSSTTSRGFIIRNFRCRAGVTGINSIRIYSPGKQALDHDPDGAFIRRFVPELVDVPTAFLAEPHLMPVDMQEKFGCRIGRDYPAPVVDHAASLRARA